MVTEKKQIKSKGVCLILSSPSGGGKTTLIRELMKTFPNLRHSISYTTRSPRNDTGDINDYHFVSPEMFRNMIKNNEFLEWAEVHGSFYGTHKGDLMALLNAGFDVILDIDVQGAQRLRETFPDGVQVFILPPSPEILEKRLRSRGSDDEQSIRRRLRNAQKEIQSYKNYHYVVVNDILSEAVDRIRSILIAEHCRVERFDPKMINYTIDR